jgi:hypothetical protein
MTMDAVSRRQMLRRSAAATRWVIGFVVSARGWATAADRARHLARGFPLFDGVLHTDTASTAPVADQPACRRSRSPSRSPPALSARSSNARHGGRVTAEPRYPRTRRLTLSTMRAERGVAPRSLERSPARRRLHPPDLRRLTGRRKAEEIAALERRRRPSAAVAFV